MPLANWARNQNLIPTCKAVTRMRCCRSLNWMRSPMFQEIPPGSTWSRKTLLQESLARLRREHGVLRNARRIGSSTLWGGSCLRKWGLYGVCPHCGSVSTGLFAEEPLSLWLKLRNLPASAGWGKPPLMLGLSAPSVEGLPGGVWLRQWRGAPMFPKPACVQLLERCVPDVLQKHLWAPPAEKLDPPNFDLACS